jgi:hypothetical protein
MSVSGRASPAIFSASSPSLASGGCLGPLESDVFPQALRHHASKGYHVCTFLKRRLLPTHGWIALATSMHYFNCFLLKYGPHRVDALTLAATCFFLMTKVDLFPVKLKDIVQTAFEVAPETEEHRLWREVLVRLEGVVCEALNYDFIVPQPMGFIKELAPAEPPRVKELALSLFSYLPMSFISQMVGAQAIAAGLLFVAADALGCPESLTGIVVSVEDREKVQRAVVEVLAFRNKTTNVERLDSMVQQVARRERLGSTALS